LNLFVLGRAPSIASRKKEMLATKMLSRFVHSRAKHFMTLIPLGLLVGVVVGAVLGSPSVGILAGLALGFLFACSLTLRIH